MRTGERIDASVNGLDVLREALTSELLATLRTGQLPLHVLAKHMALKISFAAEHFPTSFLVTGHTGPHTPVDPLDVVFICCGFQHHRTFLALDAFPLTVHPLLVLPHLVVVDKSSIALVTLVVADLQVNQPDVIPDVNNKPRAFHIGAHCSNLSVLVVWVRFLYMVH